MLTNGMPPNGGAENKPENYNERPHDQRPIEPELRAPRYNPHRELYRQLHDKLPKSNHWHLQRENNKITAYYEGPELPSKQEKDLARTLQQIAGTPVQIVHNISDAKLQKEIRSSIPEGVELFRLSVYQVALGQKSMHFAVLKLDYTVDREAAIKVWRDKLETKHGLAVIIQKVQVSSATARQLKLIADDDGIIRDANRVEGLIKGFNGRAPRERKVDKNLTFPTYGIKDLTDVPFITIDPPLAQDLDDAVWAEKLNNGNTRLLISYADVSWRVKLDSPVERYARRAIETRYGIKSAVPLLGRELAFDTLSLLPGKERIAWTVEMEVDSKGKVVQSDFYRSKIKSSGRFNFSEIQDILNGKSHAAAPLINTLAEVSQNLRAERLDRVRFFEIQENMSSHKIIEEAMIASKVKIAEFFTANNIPVMYRVFVEPDKAQLKALMEKIKDLGVPVKLSDFKNSIQFRALLNCLQDLQQRDLVHELLELYRPRARYDTEKLPHVALGVDGYVDIKGLRKYAGLRTQHQAASFFEKDQPIPNKSVFSSEARLDKEAKLVNRKIRAIDDHNFRLVTFDSIHGHLLHVGEKFRAIVTGLEHDAVRVYIPKLEKVGIVPLDSLPTIINTNTEDTSKKGLFHQFRRTELILEGYDPHRKRLVFKMP